MKNLLSLKVVKINEWNFFTLCVILVTKDKLFLLQLQNKTPNSRLF